MGESQNCITDFPLADIYKETNTMDEKNLPTDIGNTPEQEIEEKRRKEREFIKQFYCFSKKYPPMDWREFMG